MEKALLGSGSENIVIYNYINPETGFEWSMALDTLNRDNEDVVFSMRFRAVDVELEKNQTTITSTMGCLSPSPTI